MTQIDHRRGQQCPRCVVASARRRCIVVVLKRPEALSAAVVAAPAPHGEDRTGLVYGIGAYTLWGVFPLYFRAVAHVSPWVVLCHRVLWSTLFLAAVVGLRHEWSGIAHALRNRRTVVLLAAGAILISLNWLIFIYAVGTRQVLEASLGYFINPLLSIALGMVFLRERLRKLQWVAVLFALAGVLNLAVRGGGVPWIAVSLATTFGLYGLVRKKVDVNSLHGLLVETSLLLVPAVLLILIAPAARIEAGDWGLLSLSGIITAVPLLMFGAAVRRLKLSTIGFLQYIGPTLQFLLATLALREPLDRLKLGSFVLCWIAIAVYSLDSVLAHRPQEVADEPE